MKPNQTLDIQNVATEEFESIEMGFDQSAIIHLMDVLTNLYSDPALAVIREYSTNAADSHLAAGNTDPIRVSLPVGLNTNFVVQDYGVGLSVDDLYNIYSKYGRSTKRGNNVETGMLGLGCKAALAYTSSFTLEAVKDGIKTVAVISRGDNGVGNIQIIDTSSTTDPTGVKVSVPVSNPGTFARKAEDFFRFWKPGTVLVNGEQPELGGHQVSDNAFMVPRSYSDNTSNRVVMGNVSYPFNSPNFPAPRNFCSVIYVDMGEVDFTPSREELVYSDRTREAIDRHAKQFQQDSLKFVTSKLHDGLTAREAYKLYQEFGSFSVPWVWRGLSLNNQAALGESVRVYYPDRRPAVKERRYVYFSDLVQSMYVTGFTQKDITTSIRQKTMRYQVTNNLSYRSIIFCDKLPNEDIARDCHTVDYSVIKAVSLPRNASNRSTSFPIKYYRNGNTVSDKVVSGEIILFSPADREHLRNTSCTFDDKVFGLLARNRWAKFCRENSNAITIEDFIEREAKALASSMTRGDWVRLAHSNHITINALTNLHKYDLDDSELASLAKEVSESELASRARRIIRVGRELNVDASKFLREPDKYDTMVAVLDKYPLIHAAVHQPQEVADYINMVYERNNA